MKTIIKPVYYCDYCKKRYLHKGFAVKHERHCTMNPGRECGMCKLAELEQPDMKELLDKYRPRLKITDTKYTRDIQMGYKELADLQNDTNNCPACTLAILRQLGAAHLTNFDYKSAKQKFFDWEVNP